MRAVWQAGRGSLGDVRAVLAAAGQEHKPTTIGTVLRILVHKGYVRYEQFGRTHVYEPAIAQADYSARRLTSFIERFFGGSPAALVSFLAARENLSLAEIETLLDAEDVSPAGEDGGEDAGDVDADTLTAQEPRR